MNSAEFLCTLCDPPKQLKNAAGLAGNKQFVHTQQAAWLAAPEAAKAATASALQAPEATMLDRQLEQLREQLDLIQDTLSAGLAMDASRSRYTITTRPPSTTNW